MSPTTEGQIPVTKPVPMPYFIGVKLIQAKPMNLGDYNKYRDWEIPKDEDPLRDGYLVLYPDGYESWSPTTVFDKAYMAMGEDQTRINQKMVENFVKTTEVTTIGEKTTAVQTVLKNGFMLTETSSCVDPSNYDEKLGASVCINKINDKIWELLGFLLQTAIGGVK